MAKKDKNIQYHNVALHHGYYAEYEPNLRAGERYRLVGHVDLRLSSSYHDEKYNEFYNAHQAVDRRVDCWATIYRDTIVGGTVSVKFENIHGQDVNAEIDQTAFKALVIAGQKLESARLALTNGIAWQAYQEGLTPRYEPTSLQELNEQGKLEIGASLVIAGIDCGIITDCVIDDGHILIKTDKNESLYSNVDFRNEYLKITNPCYSQDNQFLAPQSQNPINKDDVVSFMLSHYQQLPLKTSSERYEDGVPGTEMIKEMSQNEKFMNVIGALMSDYVERNNITGIVYTSNQKVIDDLVGMIKCEMVDQGYYTIPMDRPTQKEFEYLQSLGYTEAAMDEKARVLATMLKDRTLTPEEQVVAQSIVDKKILHVLKDIDVNSIRLQEKLGPFEFHKKMDNWYQDTPIYALFAHGGKCRATHINLALDTQEKEIVEFDKFQKRESNGPMFGDSQVGHAENDIYVSFDVSAEYEKMGGFDYNRALEQSMGKSQKQDEPQITDNEHNEIEEEIITPGNH